jgi:phosphoribosylformylglycinamidine synthase I
VSEERPRVAVLTFPGSLDDRDALRAVATMGGEPVPVWHGDPDLHGADAAILPGGFSYGDYLRTGAIARFAPAMKAVRDLAESGGPVLGICNGFQILCEAGLLPGALIRNRSLSFVCRWVNVVVEGGPGDQGIGRPGDVLPVPIKHGEGQFVASADELDRLEGEGQVALRYCSPAGEVRDAYNPNGSARNIAGVWNGGRNVLGLMPHPEHAVDPDLGPTGGQAILGWLLSAARDRVPA